jgi:hypothetical protein
LAEVSQQEQYKLVVIPKRNLTYGIEDFVMLKKDTNPRFFRKGYVSFKDNVIHKIGEFLGKEDEILYLKRKKEYSIIHCSTYTVEKYINNLNNYSTIEANIKIKNGNFKVKDLIIMCLQLAIYQILVYCKLWELENDVTITTIENRYDFIKEKILAEIEK